jgi:tetratricopeptide (TPR) repeat protein
MTSRQWVVFVSTLLTLASSPTGLKGQSTDALTVRLIACADSAYKLMNTNQDSKAFTLLNTALHSPVRHKSRLGTTHLLYELALLKRKRGHLDQALQLLKQADTLAIQTNRIRLLGRIGYALSVVYTDLGDYAAAINRCYRTLQYNDKENDRISATYALLREIHQHMGNKILSLKYAEQSLQLMSRSVNPEDRIIYFITMAERKAQEKKYPEALAYMNKAASFTQKCSDLSGNYIRQYSPLLLENG